MHNQSNFQSSNNELAYDLIRDHPLGLLATNSSAGADVNFNYYPFCLKFEDGEGHIMTHLARTNPQWKELQNCRVAVNFLGPNGYISPVIYASKANVPTWNYCAVQIVGTAQLITSKKLIHELLEESAVYFESRNQSNWAYKLPESLTTQLESMVIGVKIKIDRIESKFKLSQNRSREDFESVVNFFERSKCSRDTTLARWMRRVNAGNNFVDS